MSANVGADYSVFITLGVDEFDRMWVLNIWREHGASYDKQIKKIKALHANFEYDVIFIESNQFQAIFPQELDREGLPVYAHNTGQNKYDFQTGLPMISVQFEKEKYRMPRGDEYSRNMTDLLVSELNSISWTEKGLQGVGAHDDMPMSLWVGTLAAKYKDLSFYFA